MVVAVNGLRVMPKWKEITDCDVHRAVVMDITVPPHESTFSLFFAPILSDITRYHWAFPESPFAPRIDDPIFFHDYYAAEIGRYLAPSTWLPKYARHMKEDWAEFYGFADKPTLEIFLDHAEDRDYDYVAKHTELCFYNVDGVWWEFYAQDPRLIESVREHVSKLDNVEVESWTLRERDNAYTR